MLSQLSEHAAKSLVSQKTPVVLIVGRPDCRSSGLCLYSAVSHPDVPVAVHVDGRWVSILSRHDTIKENCEGRAGRNTSFY